MQFFSIFVSLIVAIGAMSSGVAASASDKHEAASPHGSDRAAPAARGKAFVDEHGQSADCRAPEYHSLDYMIGQWDAVETKSGKHFLYNRVESTDGGCAIGETLRMRDNVPGSSLNFYSGSDKRWHTFYHSPTLYAVLDGEMQSDGRHVLETRIVLPGGKEPSLVRQTTTRDPHGRPRQIGVAIEPDGRTTELWDLTFCSTRRGADHSAPCDKLTAR